MDLTEPRIVESGPSKIVGCQGAFIHAMSKDANNLQVIGGLWDRLCHSMNEITHRINQDSVGVITTSDSPKHPDERLYIAGVEVDIDVELPADGRWDVVELPQAMYAVFVHMGPIREIKRTLDVIYGHWLPNSEFTHSGLADVERYGPQFHPEEKTSQMEYCVSIKRRND